jgi:hypothetical protein
MPLASPPAEPCFELNEGYFRRAWGMTAKDGALRIAPVAGVSPCFSSPEISRPARAGIEALKNMAEQQAGYGEQQDGFPSKENAPCQKQPKIREAGETDGNRARAPAGFMAGEHQSNGQSGRGGALP